MGCHSAQIEDNLYDLLDVAPELTEDLLGSVDQVRPSQLRWLTHADLLCAMSTAAIKDVLGPGSGQGVPAMRLQP